LYSIVHFRQQILSVCRVVFKRRFLLNKTRAANLKTGQGSAAMFYFWIWHGIAAKLRGPQPGTEFNGN
jgi:hypothetical protein